MDTPPSRDIPELRIADYRLVVAFVNGLTDVRFKLAAFIPTLTAAGVALITSADVEPLTQAMLGFGGLVFVLGIVVYDLRNSQLYNGAIGRAMALEETLFDRYGGDTKPGLFGSRTDTNRTHQARGTGRFLRVPVNHGTGLLLVYTATLTAWVWVILDAAGEGLLDDAGELRIGGQVLDGGDVAWWVAAVTLIVGVALGLARYRHERPPPWLRRVAVVNVGLSKSEYDAVRQLAGVLDRAVEDILHAAIAGGLPEDPGEPEEAVGRAWAMRLNDDETGLLQRRRFRRRLLTSACERRTREAVRNFLEACGSASNEGEPERV